MKTIYYLLLVVEFICILFFARKPNDLAQSSDQTYCSENLDYMSVGFINKPHFECNKHVSSPEIYNGVTLFKIWSFLFLSVTKICKEVKQSYLCFSTIAIYPILKRYDMINHCITLFCSTSYGSRKT